MTMKLDDDIALKIKHLRRTQNVTLKKVVNDALRLGLRRIREDEAEKRAKSAESY